MAESASKAVSIAMTEYTYFHHVTLVEPVKGTEVMVSVDSELPNVGIDKRQTTMAMSDMPEPKHNRRRCP